MAGAIKAVSELQANNLKEPILVVSNNDTVDQSLIKKLAHQIGQNPEESLIVGKKVDQYFPGGYIEHDDFMHLTNIIEKPEPGTEPSDMINLVYHYFSNPETLYNKVKTASSNKDDLYETTLLELVKEGQKFKVLPFAGEWIPIKNPLHIIQSARYFAHKERSQGIHPTAQIHPSAVIKGEVIIAEHAKVDANAVIQGPAYIGKNTIVGVGSFIRDSFIGENCVVGFATEIARSYIGNKTWFHKNYIGDSVIGNNVSFGAGCITGNLRLDEQEIAHGSTKFGLVTGNNIRVGIATNFMPGISIGSNSVISAGLTIAEDLPENSFVKGEYSLTVKENTKQVGER
jgi:bifunctional UDP-N-acetylglucosamine pyrophosphorylase/glucosamine-1-phosphate N-acetyltransferase